MRRRERLRMNRSQRKRASCRSTLSTAGDYESTSTVLVEPYAVTFLQNCHTLHHLFIHCKAAQLLPAILFIHQYRTTSAHRSLWHIKVCSPDCATSFHLIWQLVDRLSNSIFEIHTDDKVIGSNFPPSFDFVTFPKMILAYESFTP
jgi:hypothetical protein